MAKIIGIDLGTTFSAIAHVNQHGVPEILPNAEGDRITPSVILFEDDDVIVGNYAKQAAVVYPEQVVEFVKRHMGDPDYKLTLGCFVLKEATRSSMAELALRSKPRLTPQADGAT